MDPCQGFCECHQKPSCALHATKNENKTQTSTSSDTITYITSRLHSTSTQNLSSLKTHAIHNLNSWTNMKIPKPKDINRELYSELK